MTAYPARLVLSSGRLTVELLPEWGSKMISFRTEPDGYEFLAPAPFGPHLPDPAVFAPADAYGFDELFPGAYPQPYPAGPWQGLWLADHGDSWYRPWAYSGGGREASLWVEDARFPWYFAKTLRFRHPLALEIEYRVENRSAYPLAWLYCAHVLCPYRPGIELELPAGTYRRLETLGQLVPELCPADAPHLRWPEAFPPRSAAFYASDEIGAAACLYRDRLAGKGLRLSWTRPLAYLQVWYNSGGWLEDQPVEHMGLEPASAGSQDLVEEVKAGRLHPLPPGETVSWTLTMTVEEEPNPSQAG